MAPRYSNRVEKKWVANQLRQTASLDQVAKFVEMLEEDPPQPVRVTKLIYSKSTSTYKLLSS
jgi:hypothetical protein